MYPIRRINTIRKMKCVLFGGGDALVLSKDDFEPTTSSFFIEWDKDTGQFKMVPENDELNSKSQTCYEE